MLHSEFSFFLLTKFPHNARVGTTVDRQHRANLALSQFKQVHAPVKCLNCEPMLEELKSHDLSTSDCVVIGVREWYGDTSEKQSKFEWVLNLCLAPREADCGIYFKKNINLSFPKDPPTL